MFLNLEKTVQFRIGKLNIYQINCIVYVNNGLKRDKWIVWLVVTNLHVFIKRVKKQVVGAVKLL